MKEKLMNLQLFAEPANDAQAANQDTNGANTTDQDNRQSADQSGAKEGQSADSQSGRQENPQGGQQQGLRTFTEADVNRIVAERLSRHMRMNKNSRRDICPAGVQSVFGFTLFRLSGGSRIRF